MTPLIQRTMNAISVTNEHLFQMSEEIRERENLTFDSVREIVYVTDIDVCFSFTSREKIYRYIYKPNDAGELMFVDKQERDVCSFMTSATQSIKNDFADKKPRWDLLPIEELAGVVDVYTAGAKKYGENRWQTLENGVNRYLGAFFRHLTAYKRGEQFDPEDGCLHLDKCIWNMIAVRHCFLADKDVNPNTSDYSALQQPNGKD